MYTYNIIILSLQIFTHTMGIHGSEFWYVFVRYTKEGRTRSIIYLIYNDTIAHGRVLYMCYVSRLLSIPKFDGAYATMVINGYSNGQTSLLTLSNKTKQLTFKSNLHFSEGKTYTS